MLPRTFRMLFPQSDQYGIAMTESYNRPIPKPLPLAWHCVVSSKTLGTLYIGQNLAEAQAVMTDGVAYATAARRGDAEKLAAIAAGQMRSKDRRG